jgi:hypothetical protein
MGVLCDIGAGMYGGCRTEGTGHGCATLERAGGTAGVDAGFGGRFSNESCRITAAQSSSSSRSRLRLRRSMRETCTCET